MRFKSYTEYHKEILDQMKELSSQVNDLTSEVLSLKARINGGSIDESPKIIRSQDFISDGQFRPFRNYSRPDIVRMAQEHVGKILDKHEEDYQKIKFVVDKDSRKVMALFKARVIIDGHEFWNTHDYAIARCSIDDHFSTSIGKAIAVSRLVGIKIPDYFINAPRMGEIYKEYL